MSLPFIPRLTRGWLPPERFFKTFGEPNSSRLRVALSCTGSLTRHLEKQTGQTVQVRLESQAEVLAWEELSLLWDRCYFLPPESNILSRNAWLLFSGQVRIFAHSQVAVTKLPQKTREAIEQGDEPLGPLFLEREASVARTELELATAHVASLAQHLGQNMDTLYWCRRSLFRVNNDIRARIFEIFLPDLLS